MRLPRLIVCILKIQDLHRLCPKGVAGCLIHTKSCHCSTLRCHLCPVTNFSANTQLHVHCLRCNDEFSYTPNDLSNTYIDIVATETAIIQLFDNSQWHIGTVYCLFYIYKTLYREIERSDMCCTEPQRLLVESHGYEFI